ncbi:MAG: galactokinase [Bacteroidota bacterium]|nr:galactokinase [Bacteroidota bacterium]
MKEKLLKEFKKISDNIPALFRAPGRINLLGEHTDYNNGFVLPAAIDKSIWFAVSLRDDSEIHLHALDLEDSFFGDVKSLKISGKQWPDYLLGVLKEFDMQAPLTHGIDCVFCGDIPQGAGLSSSAALETGFAFAMNELLSRGYNKLDIVKIGQKSENDFVGLKCGIMDQFASMFGKKNSVIQLDCRSLEYEYFPFYSDKYNLLLVNTKVHHSLASSEYNLRRNECEEGVAILQKKNPEIKSLRDVSIELLLENKNAINETVFKRCKYVVEENSRVEEACAMLKKSRFERFGELMFETHFGLSEEYDVSCKELDFLVACALESDDVIGSRMMGGGFGGCTLNLVKKEAEEEFIKSVCKDFLKEFDITPEIYKVKIKNGIQQINE